MAMFPENGELLIEPKISYDEWHPTELAYNPDNKSGIAETIMSTLEEDSICILQGPPGSGKSYTIAQILNNYLNQGKTACVNKLWPIKAL
jgi:DNA replication ATP-dependent helicase Dna2